MRFYACSVKGRRVGLLGGGPFLHEAVLNAAVPHIGHCRPVLRRRHPPRQPAGHASRRRILAHQGHRQVAGCEGLRDPVQHLPGVVQIPRQYQVPQDHTLFHQPVLVVHRPSHLTKHLPYGFAGRGKVVLRPGECLSQRAVGIFQVRQIYVYLSFQLPQRIDLFIPTAVVHHRYRKLWLQGRQYPRQEMSGRHQFNVVGAPGDQLVENLPQPRCGDILSLTTGGNTAILTVAAPQGAAGEKHRSCAICAGDGRLLPLVQHGPCHPQSGGHTAESAAVLRSALCPAVTGT